MKKLILLMLVPFWLLMPEVKSQEMQENTGTRYFSLEEARAFAKENNYDVINALNDIEIARKKVEETTAIGLPQLEGSIAYNDYIDIPTMLIPDFIGQTDELLPVKFGTKYNMSASATASMLLFSGEYIVGLQASRVFVDFSQKQYDKKIIELDKSVA